MVEQGVIWFDMYQAGAKRSINRVPGAIIRPLYGEKTKHRVEHQFNES